MRIKLKNLLFEAYIENLPHFQVKLFKTLIKNGIDLTNIFLDSHKMEIFGSRIRNFVDDNYIVDKNNPNKYNIQNNTEDLVFRNLVKYATKVANSLN